MTTNASQDPRPVSVDDNGGSLTVDGVVLVDDKVRTRVLCDLQADQTIVEFLRTYLYDENGVFVSFSDTELDGSTVYVPTGTVRDCAVAAQEAGDCQSGFGGAAKHTPLTDSGNTYTTSATARRVTINYQANSAAAANRPTIQFNGGAATALGKNGDQTQVIFGTLSTCNEMGYTITVLVRQNSQHIDVFEEF